MAQGGAEKRHFLSRRGIVETEIVARHAKGFNGEFCELRECYAN
jgi:hypothetical protein